MISFRTLCSAAVLTIALLASGCGSGGDQTASTTGSPDVQGGKKIKIGFVVKTAQEPWFQTEWKFADEKAKELGVELIKEEAKDGERVSAVLDSLGAQGAQGVIICSPDVRLGPTIEASAKKYSMKLMSVDDRLVDASDKPLAEVPHLGISATEIGKLVGQGIVDEMKVRHWDMATVGACVLTTPELETGRQRVEGALEVLKAAGFPEAHVYTTPLKAGQSLEDAMTTADTIFTNHPETKQWIAFSLNDLAVLGTVRASEQHGITAENMIGIGINGSEGKEDFKKPEKTGFFASVLLQARRHGADTTEMMYKWISQGVEPPKETYTAGVLVNRENWKDTFKKEGLDQ